VMSTIFPASALRHQETLYSRAGIAIS